MGQQRYKNTRTSTMKNFSLFVCFALTMIFTSCATLGGDKPLTAQGLFDRYISEAYGPGGLDAHTSITMTGTFTIDALGVNAPITLRKKAPDSVSVVMDIPGAPARSGCSGGNCWDQQPGQGIQTLEGGMLSFQVQQADYYQYTHMGKYYQSLEIVPATDGEESENHQVRATRESGVDSYHFSRDSGMLVSTTFEMPTPQGNMTITTKTNDYQEYDGIKVATNIAAAVPAVGLTYKIVIDDVSFNELSESDFIRPQE